MTTHEERVAFVDRFRSAFPERSREDCVRAAGMLLRLSARHLELRRTLDTEKFWTDALIKRKRELERRIESICAPFELRVNFFCSPKTVVLSLPAGGFVGVPQ